MDVFDHGAAGTQIKKFEMHGMNDDMAIAILQHADYQLTNLGLPLEVHFTASWASSVGFRSPPAKALIVIDEAGTIRHTSGWPDFAKGPTASGAGPDHQRAPNAEFYSSAEKLWNAIRNDRIPADAAQISKGG